MSHRSLIGWALAFGLVASPISARAFCGFYVSGADAELFNHATMVVLMREGTHTVLSMQNDYQGPPEDFALVVPVPVVLSRDDVKILPREVFERVERLTAPRLVEYWEQDPCQPTGEGTIGLGNLGTIGHGAGSGSGYGFGAGRVVVEAEFAVGEYDIVILSASDSSALETWLRANDYRIPEGSASVLRPYVEAGTKFFVARVAIDRVEMREGRAVLSPLRVHYTSDELSLPIRLGQLNSSGTQDLIVHILARDQRYEVANRPNVTIPTNLDVRPASRERFGELYAALFDRTLERHPGAVVTEYAWQATSCDPCPPGAPLSEQDLATLGGDVALAHQDGSTASVGRIGRVRLGTPVVSGSLSAEVIRRVVRRHVNEVRFCYEQQLASQPALEGRLEMRFAIGPSGAVPMSSVASSSGNAQLDACVTRATRRWAYPAPEGGGVVTVTLPIALSSEPMSGLRSLGGFGMGNQLVVTRLHYRYGRDGSDEDLVFRAAEPIVGGRESYDETGHLEEGAMPAPYNNFQARYAIRHAWEGAVECDSPIRGVWGGPPGGTSPAPAPATGLANAPRGALQLASFVSGNVPALGLIAAADVAPEPAPAEQPVAPPTPTVDPAAATCGCRVGAPSSRGAGLALLLALVLLRARPKRRLERD